MFICDTCLAAKYDNSGSITKSAGRCEICGSTEVCNDIKSVNLKPNIKIITQEEITAENKRVEAAKERILRRRRRIYRFTQQFFHDFLIEYGGLPKGSQIRGVSTDFDTGDFKINIVNNAWAEVDSGRMPSTHWIDFDRKKIDDTVEKKS